MSLQILKPGLLTTLQDLGRYGFQKYGVIVSGAMDTSAHRLANILVGNPEQEATLEITMIGPDIRFEKETLFAVCGGDFYPTIDGEPVPPGRPVLASKGSILHIGSSWKGCRAYLAVAGGFEVTRVMGSKSTYLRAALGGHEGRALQAGDILSYGTLSNISLGIIRWLKARRGMVMTGDLVALDKPRKTGIAKSFAIAPWGITSSLVPDYSTNPIIRVTQGKEFPLFTAESKKLFFSGDYKMTPQSDRMGYRLEGPVLSLTTPVELFSEAVTFGTVQRTPDGNLVILMADRQTTGGYPKIAQVASVDLPLVAQARPGNNLHFQEISLEEAQRLYLLREKEISQLELGIALTVN